MCKSCMLVSFSGVSHVGGDMFNFVPKGDAIFMKVISHKPIRIFIKVFS